MSGPNSRLIRWISGISACGILVAIATLLLLSSDVREEIRELQRTSSVNAQWTVSQPDMELLQIMVAAFDAADGTGSISTLRRRFDVFYSRIRLLETTPFYDEDRNLEEIAAGLAAADLFLQNTTSLIDAPDEEVYKNLPQIIVGAEELRPVLRSLTLRSLQERTARGDLQREQLRLTMLRLLVAIGVFGFTLIGLILILWSMFRNARRQTQMVRNANVRVRAIISTSQDAILVISPENRILEANETAVALFGGSLSDLLNSQIGQVLPATNGTALPEPGLRFVHIEACRLDGSRFPAECSVTTIEEGSDLLRICFLRDISDRVASEAALMQSRDRALASEKAKAEVLAVMSHEMRTPLNGILGTLDLAVPGTPGKTLEVYSQVIRSAAEELLNHVNVVLEISRMDAMRLTVVKAPFDAGALMSSVLEGQNGVALRFNNSLTIAEIDPSLSSVNGDARKLQQVLLNLVGNALKFTRNGSVTLSATRNANGLAVFDVRDTGIGIDPDDIERIFEEFVTLDTSYNRESEGTGLGLSITRRLVQLMGGDLSVESVKGEGSLFRVTLPLEPIEAAPEPEPEAEIQIANPLQIMIVEDNPTNRFVLRNMLEQDGHVVTEAESGYLALDRVKEQRFDLILMDISMPGLDGIDTSTFIRQGTSPNAQTPIVALTAHAHASDHQRFEQSGIARTITKPLSRKVLRSLLLEIEPSEGTEPVVHSPPALPAPNLSDIFNEEAALELSESLGDEIYPKFLENFFAETTAALDELRSGKLGNAELAALAHRTAGSAAFFGARGLHKCLQELETAALESNNSNICAQLSELAELWKQTQICLQKLKA